MGAPTGGPGLAFDGVAAERDVQAAIRYARGHLAAHLPPWLRYHDLAHTEELVAPASELLACEEGFDARDAGLALTAAWFHDIGFTEQYLANEPVAIEHCRAVLPGFGFGPHDVEAVAAAIAATAVPQRPQDRVAEVVCDADLFVLGTERFFDREVALRTELAQAGIEHSDESWDRAQIAFLEQHAYFTRSAKARNDARKAANLAAVRARADAR